MRIHAYHAADANPIRPERISAALAEPHLLSQLRLAFHPSVQLLDSPHAVVAIWAAHQQDATLEGIDIDQAQHALILRNGLEVEVFALDPGAGTFIHHLLNDQPLLAAIENSPPFDLSQTLALLIAHHAITHLKVSP